MDYKTLMLHLPIQEPADARLQIAGDLAEQFGCKVIGSAACDLSPPPYYTDAIFDRAQALMEQERAALTTQMAELESLFRQRLQGRAKEIEWRTALTRPNEFLTRECRAADLIITGPHTGEPILDPFRHVNVSALLMQTGRPVFIVPPEVQWLRWRHVMVAWKDSREARRAVWDALPVLRKAGEVRVVEILEDNSSSSQAEGRVRDVAAWLDRHGVTATFQVLSANENAAADIHTAASDMGIDVIVAGAYGHSRLAEWVFGGVTETLVRSSNRCALLSH